MLISRDLPKQLAVMGKIYKGKNKTSPKLKSETPIIGYNSDLKLTATETLIWIIIILKQTLKKWVAWRVKCMSPRRVSRFRGKLWELREFLHKWYDNILINIASCYSGIKESNWNEPNIFFSKHWLSHFLIHLWTLPFTSRRWETFATLSWTYCGTCFGEETSHLA